MFAGEPIEGGVQVETRSRDTVLTIQAQDGGREFRSAYLDLSYNAETTIEQFATLAAEAMGLSLGTFDLGDADPRLPTMTLSGPVSDQLRRLAGMAGLVVTTRDRALHIYPSGSSSGESAILFRSGEGSSNPGNLIGSPIRRDEGKGRDPRSARPNPPPWSALPGGLSPHQRRLRCGGRELSGQHPRPRLLRRSDREASMTTVKPTGSDFMDRMGISARGPVKVSYPAEVISYDRATQTAVIQLAIPYCTSNRGEVTQRSYPPIPGVPVQWLGITWDLDAGETGLAVICDRALDEWKATGLAGTTPADPRRFDVSDAVFLPGVSPSGVPLESDAYASDAVVLWDRGTSDIRLGSSGASDAVALSSLVEANDSTMKSALLAAITAALVAVPGDPAFTAFQSSLVTALTAFPASTGASKVKAE